MVEDGRIRTAKLVVDSDPDCEKCKVAYPFRRLTILGEDLGGIACSYNGDGQALMTFEKTLSRESVDLLLSMLGVSCNPKQVDLFSL